MYLDETFDRLVKKAPRIKEYFRKDRGHIALIYIYALLLLFYSYGLLLVVNFPCSTSYEVLGICGEKHQKLHRICMVISKTNSIGKSVFPRLGENLLSLPN